MSLQLNWTRGLWLWVGLLGLALACAVIPLPLAGRLWLVLAILVVVGLGWIVAGRRDKARSSLLLAKGCSLPSAEFALPVVAVCGDDLAMLFGDAAEDRLVLRVTAQGCYLRVTSVDQLASVIDQVLANRPHWSGQIGVFHVVNPAAQQDPAILAGNLRGFRQQMARLRRGGLALPVVLGSYLQSAQGDGSWFIRGCESEALTVDDGSGSVDAARWQALPADLVTRSARLGAHIEAQSLARWVTRAVLPHLTSREGRETPCSPIACAQMLTAGGPSLRTDSLWSDWLLERTALQASGREAGHTPLPFPDPLLPRLPRRPGVTPARRATLRALWLFVLAAAIGLCSSAWQNVLLVRQLSDDLLRFQAIAEPTSPDQLEHRQREQAIVVLRNDAARLDRYYREGEPLPLGLGLYAAERIRRPLLAAIAAYRPPMSVVHATMKIPDPVRLDSLSLFGSGSAQLKPGSTKVLVNALVGIKAQPGWLIVVAGHTDSTGDEARNLVLSRDRAAAVRDWMQQMGDLPDSCFAVQGHGAAQPIASNDTPAGRAANRRVDIRLVPETGACAVPAQAPEGQPQSPRYQATLSSQ